ncbi:MAG: hypothetical protein WA412_13575, partial [Candidatus Sulfotelmatobacter sp.]
LDPGPKVFRADHIIVSFEELELPAKHLRSHQISIERNFRDGMIGRNNSMVVHNRIAAGRHSVIEPSDSM